MPWCPSTTLFSQCIITHLELEVVVEDAMQSSDVVNNAVPDGRTPTTTCVVHGYESMNHLLTLTISVTTT